MYSEHLARFIDAYRAGDTAAAVDSARRMVAARGEGLRRHEAMELLFLFARDEDPRFPKAAARFIVMLKREGVQPEIVAAATATVMWLPYEPAVAKRCEKALRALMSAVD